MFEFVEARPGLAALVVVGGALALVVEWLMRRRRGTWVPFRRRRFAGPSILRWAIVVVMALAAAFFVWQTVFGLRTDRPGVAIMGVGLAAFCAWAACIGAVRGRDVDGSPET